jgi:hypothetical protein
MSRLAHLLNMTALEGSRTDKGNGKAAKFRATDKKRISASSDTAL